MMQKTTPHVTVGWAKSPGTKRPAGQRRIAILPTRWGCAKRRCTPYDSAVVDRSVH